MAGKPDIPNPLVPKEKDVAYWVKFVAGIAIGGWVLHVDVQSGGVVPNGVYGIPAVLLLGVTPREFMDMVKGLTDMLRAWRGK